MSRSLWRLSINLLQQLHGFLYSAHDRSEAAAKIYYKLMVDSKRHDSPVESSQIERRKGTLVFIKPTHCLYQAHTNIVIWAFLAGPPTEGPPAQ
ncbi:hypothetical protein EVAR_4870_1 [Eumeta japonica]|uniref:Uncharacterized protein n=1 Tax=Eumeta variegata TaxID=151549 RepID=A0A4C1T1W1_EUMVA|nr:hypothetical protein EVAR_4870_1 [Eumeta japonica]